MAAKYTWLWSAVCAAAGMLLAHTVNAQTDAEAGESGAPQPAAVEVRAEPLTVPLTRCWKIAWGKCDDLSVPVERLLFVEASQTIEIGASGRPLDDTEGGVSLPLTAFSVPKTGITVDRDHGVNIPLIFKLNDAPSGQYTSQVRISYPGGKVVVPVTVTIRDPVDGPLIVIIIGLVLGLSVTAYAEYGRDRDDLSLRANRLEDRVTKAWRVHEVFREKILTELERVHFNILRGDLEEAKKASASADGLWKKWRNAASQWAHRLDNLDDILEGISRLARRNDPMHKLEQELKIVRIGAVDLEAPDDLTSVLDNADAMFQNADFLNNKLLRLEAVTNEAAEQMPEEERRQRIGEMENLLDRFKHLPLNDQGKYDAFLAEVDAAMDKLPRVAAMPRTAEWPGGTGWGGPASAPYGIDYDTTGGPTGAGRVWYWLTGRWYALRHGVGLSVRWLSRMRMRGRRFLFKIAGYSVLMIILAGSGLGELYLDNASFGANVWSDYLSLFAWGFGAEATRSSFMKLAGTWQLPGFRRAAQ